MSKDLTDLQLLHELEPVVEKNLNRHLSMYKDWNPHDYIPWSDDPRTARVEYRLDHGLPAWLASNKSGRAQSTGSSHHHHQTPRWPSSCAVSRCSLPKL
jgi:Fatty acid desaturase